MITFVFLLSCEATPTAPITTATPTVVEASSPPATDAAGTEVFEAYPPPQAAHRVDGGRFGVWLSHLKLRDRSTPITTYNDQVVHHDGRVLDIPLTSGDLQQCADSIIRLYATWQRSTHQPISFHATSGDEMPFSRFQGGERPYEKGNKLAWKPAPALDFEGYLKMVFMWAGTRSLPMDSIAVSDPRPGDFLVTPGSPGHAVLLMDVAKSEDKTFVLVAEGFMPAQTMHIEHGPVGGWYVYDKGVTLSHWSMPASGLRRFKGDN